MHFVVMDEEDDAVVVSVLESVTDLELAVVVVSELAEVDPEALVVTACSMHCGIKAYTMKSACDSGMFVGSI